MPGLDLDTLPPNDTQPQQDASADSPKVRAALAALTEALLPICRKHRMLLVPCDGAPLTVSDAASAPVVTAARHLDFALLRLHPPRTPRTRADQILAAEAFRSALLHLAERMQFTFGRADALPGTLMIVDFERERFDKKMGALIADPSLVLRLLSR